MLDSPVMHIWTILLGTLWIVIAIACGEYFGLPGIVIGTVLPAICLRWAYRRMGDSSLSE